MEQASIYKDILFGVAVGDALGVPVEFKSREAISQRPVKDMTGYGTYNLPAGTWSDDSSLTFCLAEALTGDFSLHAVAQNFTRWLDTNYWTPLGSVFDVGIATREAICRLKRGVQPDLAGGLDEQDNGNGSLMRILPLLLYIKDKTIEKRFLLTQQVSSLTHGHIRSVIACFYYLEYARLLAEAKDKFEAYQRLQGYLPSWLDSFSINPKEIRQFDRLLKEDIFKRPEAEIYSSGYVLHSLEASIWCLLTTASYKDAVLKAVNLGNDTDTTGAITGGLAGLIYGFDNIPKTWIEQLARKADIEDLSVRLEARFIDNKK